MRKYFATFAAVLFFFFTATSQNVGDREKQTVVFGSQPTWEQLSSKDSFRRMVFSDYIECKPGDKIICWNAITEGMAEVQEFLPTDSIFVAKHENKEYFYKLKKCRNRLRYIRLVKIEPLTLTPAPKPDTIHDTLYVEVPVEWGEPVLYVEEVPVYFYRGYYCAPRPTGAFYVQGAYLTCGAYFVCGGYTAYTCAPKYGNYCPPVVRDCWEKPRIPTCDSRNGWGYQNSDDRYYGSRQTGSSALADNSSARQRETTTTRASESKTSSSQDWRVADVARPQTDSRARHESAPRTTSRREQSTPQVDRRKENRGGSLKPQPQPRQERNTATFEQNRQRNNQSVTPPVVNRNNRQSAAPSYRQQAQARAPQASNRSQNRGRN